MAILTLCKSMKQLCVTVKIVDLEDALGRNQDELDSRKTQCDDLEVGPK